MDNAIVTLVETDFKCPKCECVHHEDDYFSKMYASDSGFFYQKCKGCKTKLGITTNIMGDVLVWLKEDETN